jgi:hypothetical protein
VTRRGSPPGRAIQHYNTAGSRHPNMPATYPRSPHTVISAGISGTRNPRIWPARISTRNVLTSAPNWAGVCVFLGMGLVSR